MKETGQYISASDAPREGYPGLDIVLIVEPLARSTGHQSWFASNLAVALSQAGLRPVLLTFDGVHEDAERLCREKGCEVLCVYTMAPAWLRWIFVRMTGVAAGGTAAPSEVRWRFQIYFYNAVATAVSVLFGCRVASRGPWSVIHLLCPPSSLVVGCLALARPQTRVVITAFAPPSGFHGRLARLKEMCRSHAVTIVVQTETLANAWAEAVGPDAVRMIPLPAEERFRAGNRHESRRLLDLPEDKPIVAVIGCMGPTKGYIELFQAIRQMPKDFHVLLIGDTGNWMAPDPQDVVREAGWAENTIIRRKFVPERLMPALFGAIDIVALLYRDPNASSGILSLSQRYGVPVLATRFGEIGARVVSQNLGLTADPYNPEEVRCALKKLLEHTAGGDGNLDRSRAGPDPDRALVSVTPFPWAAVADAHQSLYLELQGSKDHRF